MKRFLVLLLCGMLMMPTAAMSAQAAETQTAESGQPENPDDETKDTVENRQKAAEKVTRDLMDYYTNLEFTNTEKSQADAVMKKAGEKLGYDYDAKTGKFTLSATFSLKLGTMDGIAAHLDKMKTQLDACKTPAPEPQAPEAPTVNSNIIIGGKEYDTTIANAGQDCEIAVPLVNVGSSDVTDITITPALGSDVTTWPFEISKTDYSQVWDSLPGEASGQDIPTRKHTFRWALKTRNDAVTGYTKLTFNVSYVEANGTKAGTTLDYYVQVNGVAPTDPETGGKISTPRVIVTGFTTDPGEVYAGDTFKLTLNLKNTSKQTAVSNMLFDIQGTQEGTDAQNTYAAFLPTAGSSTIFVEKIAANASKSITIELKSKSDLAQKPYVVTVNMEYEDNEKNAFTETASVSIPIKQEPKVDVSSITLMPDNVEIGNEANVMFSIYNVGKTKLYNVNVKFEADSVSGGDTFIGNLEPGATGNVDAYLAAQAATMDDGTVKVLITYEDEEGKKASIEKTMTLFVSEPFFDPGMMNPGMMEPMPEEKAEMPWWGYVLIAVGAAAVIAIVIVVVKKKKKAKKLAQEELETIAAAEAEDNGAEE